MLRPFSLMPPILIGMLIASAAPACAHHSFSVYDWHKDLVLVGTVKSVQFTNPHTVIRILVPNEGGTVEWQVELGPPGHLFRAGWSRRTLKSGDKATIVVNPMRDGSPVGAYLTGTGPDGKRLGER